jgi:hypothetical protein
MCAMSIVYTHFEDFGKNHVYSQDAIDFDAPASTMPSWPVSGPTSNEGHSEVRQKGKRSGPEIAFHGA